MGTIADYPVTFGYLATNCARQPLTVDGDKTTIHATRGDILRIARHKDNSRNTKLSKNNTSGYNGFMWRPDRNKWEARIKHNYKDILLGRFEDLEDAASCRYAASIALFGEYARELRHG